MATNNQYEIINTKNKNNYKEIRQFINHNYRHFNAAVVKDAAHAYCEHLQKGGQMMATLAGAMSTAELGVSLAEMIRRDKIHAVSCTGANLEEDIFNLVAHNHYRRLPHYRELTAQQENELRQSGLSRVTDTCIPEDEAMTKIDQIMVEIWSLAEKSGQRKFPYEFFYEILLSGKLEQYYEINPRDSWVLAAAKKNLPLFVPGWEDSTMGNSFASELIMQKTLKNPHTVKSGIEYMLELVQWYEKTDAAGAGIGFFQIGGGIAGDFPICVVPLIRLDLQRKCRPWQFFCQISDSTTSYGSYSGAVPNEKITWNKLEPETPRFIIESDATIVAPLIFAYVLGD
ncbi:deoxyhypusine synthase family protein [Patescibacteria group bacterium]|nr:deoxyhypusine synthase family protein [Patescibacteria group bacterium]MBU0964399.1 deoxyhypusine synthase family protein [Patescibacteria group bacterium]